MLPLFLILVLEICNTYTFFLDWKLRFLAIFNKSVSAADFSFLKFWKTHAFGVSLESVWKLVRAASQLKRWSVTRKTVKTKSHTAKAKRTSSGMQWPAPSIQGKSKEIPISVKPKLREPQGIGLPYHPQTIQAHSLSRLNPPHTTVPS